MLKKILVAVALSASTLAPTALPAAAQQIIIDENGVRIRPDDPRYDMYRRGIDRDDARRIARREGMRRVVDVDRRGRTFVVRGEDRRDRPMRVTIDARSGRVLDVDIARGRRF
ncbi:PepSY domain-containing protein [Prosthecomicrobium pneumaticum]|uniref:PepSY domain-containing protein n=1 Tax=Prosthecomicrobium pneumaticum TaxID=81895 RepID=A0A7W9FJW6_9HYPH|nr:PepSY domain-containing protein [Prosthecomicrobium pneumaticum]MBB5752157.1 hypothetical protein [Prosthecomicrobium pneumaticum]